MYMMKKAGQSLIEAVVAVAVVIVLVTGIIAGTTSSLRSSAYARARSEATKLVQQAIEIARADRDANWSTFYARSGNSYCLGNANVLIAAADPVADCANNKSITASSLTINFTRYITFSYDSGNERMIVTAFVIWNEGSAQRTSRAETYFTQWK